MNSGQNKPFTQLFQNSETGISEKMQGVYCEKEINKLLDDMPMERIPVVTAEMSADRIVQAFRGGARVMMVGRDVEVVVIDAGERHPVELPTFSWEHEKAQRPDRYQGITNDPKVALAGAGGGRRAYGKTSLMLAALVSLGARADDVVFTGEGGRLRDVALGYDPFQFAEEVEDLSPHPGERHRQLSRKLTSSRSRAGKAARWAS